jgi:hypothetical protein
MLILLTVLVLAIAIITVFYEITVKQLHAVCKECIDLCSEETVRSKQCRSYNCPMPSMLCLFERDVSDTSADSVW